MFARVRAGLASLVLLAVVGGLLVEAGLTAPSKESNDDISVMEKGGPRPPEFDPSLAPLAGGRGKEQLLEGLRREKERVAEFERRLASAEWRAERDRSKTEFVGLSRGGAKSLAEETFGELLEGAYAPLAFDPAEDGRAVREVIDDHTVLVAGNGKQPPALVESPWPVRAVDDDGREKLVDLALVQEPGGFAPSNAVADLSLPGSLQDGISVGPVNVVPAGAAEGELSGDGRDRVIYPNAEIDTDVIVTPLATGVEVFWQLRSARSPEELRLDLRLPERAVLQASGAGPAVVVRDGETVTTVSPPVAFDAQGQEVAVDMAVVGQRLVVSLAHRAADIAYPILVDPILEDYWHPDDQASWFDQHPWSIDRLHEWFHSYGGVQPNDYAPRTDCYEVVSCDPAVGRPHNYWLPDGLHYYVRPGFTYPANSQAWWIYRAPGTTTQISNAGMYSFYHRRGGSMYPMMVSGIWNDQYWVSNLGYTMDHAYMTQGFTGGASHPGTQSLVFGFWTPNTVSNGSWRDGYIGAARIDLTDPEPPTINGGQLMRAEMIPPGYTHDAWVNLNNHTRWVKPQDSLAILPNVSDPGLGVRIVAVTGTGINYGNDRECVGNKYWPCPATWGADAYNDGLLRFFPTHLPDGPNWVTLHAWDPIYREQTQGFPISVDSQVPTIPDTAISGSLWAGREDDTLTPEEQPSLSPGVHNISVTATDPVPFGYSPSLVRSGVERIVIKVDGHVEHTSEGVCPAGNCTRSTSWDYNTAHFGGRHTVDIEAIDGAGNVGRKTFVVNAQADGELLYPDDGETTSSKIALQAKDNGNGFTAVRFEYRRTPFGQWTTINTHLTDDQAAPISGDTHLLSESGRRTKKLIWDARTVIGAMVPSTTEVQVRAVFTGAGDEFGSRVATVNLDSKGISADNATNSIGPGSVDLLTGNFSYTATDATLPSYGGPISVARTFNAADPKAHGPLGPGWVLSAPMSGVSEYSSLVVVPEGLVDVFDSGGRRIRFQRVGDTSFESAPGFEMLTLRRLVTSGQPDRYTITDLDGVITTFVMPPGTTTFVPAKVQSPGTQAAASFMYEDHLGQPRLRRIIAPGADINCNVNVNEGIDNPVISLPRGCGMLQLEYHQSGSLAGLLRAVTHTAYDPSTAGMRRDTVAEFAYLDVGGVRRLHKAWDPRLGSAEVAAEVYDWTGPWPALGKITRPGEASWNIEYLAGGVADTPKLARVFRDTASGREMYEMAWNVALWGPSAPHDMSGARVDDWGQTDRPTDATAIVPTDQVGGDIAGATISYLNQDGRVVNTARPGGAIAMSEYDVKGNVVRELTAANRAAALAAGGDTATRAGLLSTYRTYAARGLRLVDELGPQHEVKLDSGQVVEARAHSVTTYDEGKPVGMKPPHLATTVTTGAQIEPSDPDADLRTVKTQYDWTFRKPTRTIVDAVSGGLNITRETSYNGDGLETSSRQPKSNGADAGATQTLYYTADASSSDPACRSKPEWFNLPCKTRPAAQPATTGLPDLPTTTYQYNRSLQVTTATERVGDVSRTTTTTYDAAGRRLSSALSSTDQASGSGGLVGAWGFEEASGTTTGDSSSQGNHGGIENAARVEEGRFGRAMRFDGAGDLVRVADNASLDVTGAMTLEAWVRPDPVIGMSFPEVVGKLGTGTSCSHVYSLRVVSGYLPDPFAWGGRCSGAVYATTSPTAQAAWSHLAMTVDGANVARLYVNGAEVATTTMAASTASNAADLLIGSGFVGLVDEVRLYNRKLSAEDVATDMLAPVDPAAVATVSPPTQRSGLVGAFGFEEQPDSLTVGDSSANANDGELGGAVRAPGGRHGGAITTSDGMATVPDSGGLLSLTGSMTIDSWVGLEHGYDEYSDPYGVIAGKADAYVLRINPDGEAEFAIDPSGSGSFDPQYTVVATGVDVFGSDRMVHVTGTYDGSYLRIYVDGELAGEGAVDSGPPGGSEPFTIGGSNYDAPLAATIDEVRVYDRALSDSEIDQDATIPVALPAIGDPSPAPPSAPHPVATTTYGYSPTTGRPTTVSTPSGTVTTGYDNAGRVTSYTDADGTTSTTTYDNFGRPSTTTDGKGTQTLTYDSTTGMLTSLVDSHAGTFTASFDHDGRIVSKTYPNGMKADTAYDEAGAPIRLTYTKTSNCSSNCTWVDEQVSESIHGQWRTHSWELSSQEYTYDKAGRLTSVEDDVHAPAAVEGCTIRSYAFDQNSNRTTMNTKAPASNGDCQFGAAGTSKTYAYDDADRLTGAGLQYDSFGRMTSIPAAHSGGGVLTYRYYVNDQVRTIAQDGVSKTYALDPTGRQRQSIEGDGTTHTETLHYQDGSDSPSWTRVANTQGQEVSWERNVEGIDGDLAAIHTHTAQADTTVLQLQNLHGDIVATASTDPNATALTARFETDEFGNPRQQTGRRYGYLGGKQRRSELASGVIQMGVRSYLPALGRFTSVDPVDGGSATPYDYAMADPINSFDPDGRRSRCIASPMIPGVSKTHPNGYVRAKNKRWVYGRAVLQDCKDQAVLLEVCTQQYINGAWNESTHGCKRYATPMPRSKQPGEKLLMQCGQKGPGTAYRTLIRYKNSQMNTTLRVYGPVFRRRGCYGEEI